MYPWLGLRCSAARLRRRALCGQRGRDSDEENKDIFDRLVASKIHRHLRPVGKAPMDFRVSGGDGGGEGSQMLL